MHLLRVLVPLLFLIALAIPLSAAMATGHDLPAAPVAQAVDVDLAEAGHGGCCDRPDRSSSCQVPCAVVPAPAAGDAGPVRVDAIRPGPPVTATGRSSDGLLDPPRLS